MVELNEISAHFTASLRLVSGLNDAVEDGLAVFHLADLEIIVSPIASMKLPAS